jgi:processing peptidase subunit beta
MASRRLALNLTQGLSKRAAFSAPVKRGFATPITSRKGVVTETTTLSNGLTVCARRTGDLGEAQLADGDI